MAGKQSAADEDMFRRIANAYEILKDEAVRAEYNEFVDHPERFFQHYATWMRRRYFGHQESVGNVFVLILITATIVDWIHRRSRAPLMYVGSHCLTVVVDVYHELRSRLVYEPKVQERVRALRGLPAASAMDAKGKRKSKRRADDLDDITDAEISAVVEMPNWTGGPPTWRDSLPMRMSHWPVHIAKFLAWAARWLVLFTILRRPYGDDEKAFLLRRNLCLSQGAWQALPEHRRKALWDLELWDVDAYQAWRRRQRQRNKGGDDYDSDFVD